MLVKNENRAFLRKLSKGRFVADVNFGGVQKTIWFYPNVGDEGTVENWSGPIHDAKEEGDEGKPQEEVKESTPPADKMEDVNF